MFKAAKMLHASGANIFTTTDAVAMPNLLQNQNHFSGVKSTPCKQEDNFAAQIIAHAGKLTYNVCHIATKTKALKEHVRHAHVSFHRVSSACNLADHFTKALTFATLRAHCMTIMGYAFIDHLHGALVPSLDSSPPLL